MKVEINSKKGLQTTLSVIVDKAEVKKELDIRLIEYQKQIDIKGFRKGKVPPLVIKNQLLNWASGGIGIRAGLRNQCRKA